MKQWKMLRRSSILLRCARFLGCCNFIWALAALHGFMLLLDSGKWWQLKPSFSGIRTSGRKSEQTLFFGQHFPKGA